MFTIEQRVRDVQIRQQRQWLWQCVSVGLLAGGSIGTVAAIIRILAEGTISWLWVVTAVLVPVFLAASVAIVNSRSILHAARAIDSQCGLKDRTETAMQFLSSATGNSPLQRLQVQDAENHLQAVDPLNVVPMRIPRSWGCGVLMTVMACILSCFAGQSEQISAAMETNAIIVAQADRVENSMEELEQFQHDQNDPELEMLLKQLACQITELKEPGIDPKEALARLSEMEAALQEMQQQVAATSVEAELKEVGEALSLAEEMVAAGQAIVNGDMDKASEELSKLEVPELDRKTEKAITEKLQQIQDRQSDTRPKEDLKESLAKAVKGMTTGDKKAFQEGMKGLAGECKKQSQKKKLSNLLQKQSQSLSESKIACETESRAQIQSNKKGGMNAGKGSADLYGDQTAKQQAVSEMNLKGEDSGNGDSDTETEKGTEQQQEAVRQYRQNADKYEAMSETVLESESIPLGHRQMIRRYFELIRPTAVESDTANVNPSE
jgi:hypothetical protein